LLPQKLPILNKGNREQVKIIKLLSAGKKHLSDQSGNTWKE
jgi:hypothetical protein